MDLPPSLPRRDTPHSAHACLHLPSHYTTRRVCLAAPLRQHCSARAECRAGVSPPPVFVARRSPLRLVQSTKCAVRPAGRGICIRRRRPPALMTMAARTGDGSARPPPLTGIEARQQRATAAPARSNRAAGGEGDGGRTPGVQGGREGHNSSPGTASSFAQHSAASDSSFGRLPVRVMKA